MGWKGGFFLRPKPNFNVAIRRLNVDVVNADNRWGYAFVQTGEVVSLALSLDISACY